jgi:DNA-binding transcriptional regulator YbjK
VIAAAATTVIARDGLRALTHRAVDAEAQLPPGSTTYYASTRQALLELVARRLAERTAADLRWFGAELASRSEQPRSDDPADAVAAVLADLVRRLAARRDDQRSRFALLIDTVDREPVRSILTSGSPAAGDALATTAALLRRFGLAATAAHVQQLVLFTDGVLFTVVTRAGFGAELVDVDGVLRAQVRTLLPREE